MKYWKTVSNEISSIPATFRGEGGGTSVKQASKSFYRSSKKLWGKGEQEVGDNFSVCVLNHSFYKTRLMLSIFLIITLV